MKSNLKAFLKMFLGLINIVLGIWNLTFGTILNLFCSFFAFSVGCYTLLDDWGLNNEDFGYRS